MPRNGKRCTSTTEGAVKHVEHTDTYYAKINGKVISLETTDEGEAWAKLKRTLKRLSDERAGIRDQHTDAAELPLSSHVDDWIATVRAKGSGEGHLQLMRTRVLPGRARTANHAACHRRRETITLATSSSSRAGLPEGSIGD